MKLFKKQPTFIVAECQKCGGPLELDTNYETAHCLNCSSQYIVHNVDKKKRQKRTNFEMVMDYIEKGRDLKRKDKVEKIKKKEEKELAERKATKIALIIFGSIFVVLISLIGILTSLGILE